MIIESSEVSSVTKDTATSHRTSNNQKILPRDDVILSCHNNSIFFLKHAAPDTHLVLSFCSKINRMIPVQWIHHFPVILYLTTRCQLQQRYCEWIFNVKAIIIVSTPRSPGLKMKMMTVAEYSLMSMRKMSKLCWIKIKTLSIDVLQSLGLIADCTYLALSLQNSSFHHALSLAITMPTQPILWSNHHI